MQYDHLPTAVPSTVVISTLKFLGVGLCCTFTVTGAIMSPSINVYDASLKPTTYYGSCGRASIDVQFRMTSQYPSNRYGPQCTHECINLQRKTFCNYIGDTIDLCPYGADCVCKGNFLEPNCILCDENYYPLTYATFNVSHRTTHLATIHVILRVVIESALRAIQIP